jgi:nucleoside-diphosphate-sugar epimerase
MKILITGGCGYIGSVLTKKLLKNGYEVIVYDTQWFGNYLIKNKNLKIIKDDIRNIRNYSLKNINTIIHLANIANDPGVELNQTLSWEVNVLATQMLIEKAVKDKVKHFIFSSSGSVYGIKKEKKVTENLELVPISAYNKTKMVAEKVVESYKHLIKTHIIRPATVCGVSPRMRLDVSVNMFTYQAVKNNKMTVFGGNQVRPNIHINDIVEVFYYFLKNPKLTSGAYNAGFENIKILDIAQKIKKITNAKIIVSKSNDQRSYRQDSTKLLKTGFIKKYSVLDAINEVREWCNTNNNSNIKKYFTVKWMKKLGL